MFITRKRHEEVVSLLRESHEKHVVALLEQIADLRSLVFTPTSATNIPEVQFEADKAITQNDPGPPSEEEIKQARDELRERDLILSGEYADLS